MMVATEHKPCPFCEGKGTLLGAGPDRGNPQCDICKGTGEAPLQKSLFPPTEVVHVSRAAIDPGEVAHFSFGLKHAGFITKIIALPDMDYEAFELLGISCNGRSQLPADYSPQRASWMISHPLSSGTRMDMVEAHPDGVIEFDVKNISAEPRKFEVCFVALSRRRP